MPKEDLFLIGCFMPLVSSFLERAAGLLGRKSDDEDDHFPSITVYTLWLFKTQHATFPMQTEQIMAKFRAAEDGRTYKSMSREDVLKTILDGDRNSLG